MILRRDLDTALATGKLAFGAVLLTVCAAGCESSSSPPTASSAMPVPALRNAQVQIVPVPPDTADARSLIRAEADRARREGRVLIVYVGAPWCEPCQRFHQAAAAGELNQRFPTLRLLEFDRDMHEAALADAGCLSRMIPLFARPTSDGRCSPDRRVEGGIKGEGAVAFIVPRLEQMMRP
jgi:thiol-disulfide isomerase/thioredoxin